MGKVGTRQVNACKHKINKCYQNKSLIKEYTCLPQLLVATQILQTLALGSSQMAPRLPVTDKLSKHKCMQANNENKLK